MKTCLGCKIQKEEAAKRGNPIFLLAEKEESELMTIFVKDREILLCRDCFRHSKAIIEKLTKQ